MGQNGVLEIPCLGKPFKLGMLYDCRRDHLIPDVTLWNDDILSNALASPYSKHSQCQIYTDDSLEKKLEMLGVHKNIKLSFLSGLVDAPSYVNFFEDGVSPMQKARVTLKYESIATFEELDCRSLPYDDFDKQKNATHFVSGVLYGSNTFFVFDRDVKRNESYANVSGDMELLISSLSDISINDVGSVKIPEMHKEEAKKLTCTVYGDNPTSNSTLSFDEAVKLFDELRNNRGPVAPVKAFLQPLSSLDSEAARYFNDVSIETISQVMNTMETFTDINTRLNVLTKTKAFTNFSSIKKKVSKFRAMITQYKNALQKNLSVLLPRVRGGDAKEDELMQVLKEVATTPFSQAFLSSWVDKAEKEIKLLSMYLDHFNGIQFAFEPEELDSVINALEHDRVVCFSFMIQDVQDEQLEDMYTFLRNGQFQQKPAKQRNWYENQVIINDFKTQARRFTSYFKTNVNNNSIKFVVTNIANDSKEDKIAVIQMFQDGQPIEFESDGRNDHSSHTTTQATPILAEPPILAELMRNESEKIKSGKGMDSVCIYKVPTKETMREQNKKLVKKCVNYPREARRRNVGGEPQEKVLMVMGATGAGKSTLINGMINYIMGVKWEDEFRFKLIDESSSPQAHSVTKEITAYTIPLMGGAALPYAITIVDTPGYGDTEGLKRDITITKQIKDFFSLGSPTGIDHLDGIGFVTQSSLARLTPTQTYIFDAILSIFGKDMGNNIFMMVTFADGQYPPVLRAVKEAKISYQNFFKFNNSALFAPNANSGFDQMFWQMGKASFKEFFCTFQSTKSVRLEQTNKVLEEREQLEVLVEGINPRIKEGLAKLEEMRHERMALQEHESQMEHNKDFEFTVPTMKTKQTDLRGTGKHTTTCLKCNKTCHKDCKISDDSQKRGCSAIDRNNGNCKVCPKECYWNDHKNLPYLIEYETVYEKRRSEDLKKKYDMGKQGKNKVEAMLKTLENIYHELRIEIVRNMYEVRLCLHRLDEIALKPNPLTEVDYIELLIEAEKNERKEGWMDRVKAYEEVKSKAAVFVQIKSAKEIPKLVNEILPKQDESSTSGKNVQKRGSQCAIQ